MKKLLIILVSVSIVSQTFAHNKHKTIYLKGSNKGYIEAGYRGFVETGFIMPIFETSGSYYNIELTTTHGYQIIPQLYTGLGAGVNYLYKNNRFRVPIFADIRSDILDKQITPFIDIKLGYISHPNSYFINPSIGCRISNILNLSIGLYMNNHLKFKYYGYTSNHDSEAKLIHFYENLKLINIRLGFSF